MSPRPRSPDSSDAPRGPGPDAAGPAAAGSASDWGDARAPAPGAAAAGPPPGPTPPGPAIEGYALKEEIHRGGQGVVYRAVQLGTKREVALKVLLEGPFAGEGTRRRFEREIELAAGLRHPNIVTILDSGLSFGRYYFAMEYVHGLRLDRYLARHRPPLEDVLRLFEKICDAVNYAHQRGVIHRDLKPPNILVDELGEPHVLDFGLAKHLRVTGGQDSTIPVLSTSGQILGTVAYMSPEQAAGSQDVDVRSDVYSLGVIFYEALVGQPPYPVTGPLGEVLNRIARDDPANPRAAAARRPGGRRIDDELATILLKALEKEPARRYQTAGELGRDIRRRLDGDPVEAKRASGLYLFRKALRRYRLQAATAGVILLMLVGFLITFAILFTSEREARRRADDKTREAHAAAREREQALARAIAAQLELRRALLREHIQRGDLALARGDLIEARDSYWDALSLAPDPAAVWALRRYYLQSPNIGATLLGCESGVRCRLSPDAAAVAVPTGPASVTVQQLDSAQALNWVRTPGPPALLDLCADGTLAAVAYPWVRAWPAGSLRPSVAARLPEFLASPQAVHALPGGGGVLVVGPQQAALFTADSADPVALAFLQARVRDGGDAAPCGRHVAVITAAGLELLTIADGRLTARLVWSGHPPRAVRFDGDERLTVLADVAGADDRPASTVFTGALAQLGPNGWTPVLRSDGQWDFVDACAELGFVALGSRDGRLAVYEHGQALAGWAARGAQLEDLRLSRRDRSLVTLDDRRTLTTWVAPQRIEQRRRVHEGDPVVWAGAADGSAVVMAVGRGQVVAYAPDRTPASRTLLRPRLLDLARGEIALDINADGTRAVILDGTTLRFAEVTTGALSAAVWRDAALPRPVAVAISDDGELVALLVRSQVGDHQQVVFYRWPGRGPARRAPPPAPFEFAGALVLDLAFRPQTRQVLVVRSSGQLYLLDPEQADRPPPLAGAAGQPAALAPWLELGVLAESVSFSRSGRYLAAGCEDGTVRVIDVAGRAVAQRIPLRGPVGALSFNPRNDLLLVRTADGAVHLFDPATGAGVASWAQDAAGRRPLACWIGQADGLLLSGAAGVQEYRYQLADELIERNRPLAAQRAVARELAGGRFGAAWEAATALCLRSPRRGHAARVSVLEAALRRPGQVIPPEWAEAVLADAGPAVRARLGHAAYDGERFETARQWLGSACSQSRGEVDALTAWRAAECDYLADAYAEAAAGLAAVLARPDFDAAAAPAAALERVAALVLAGRPDEARRAAAELGAIERRGRGADLVAATAARMIARFITGLEGERLLEAGLDSLVTSFAERSLDYRDDVHFFTGELERQRGNLAQAAAQYQRCIDLSRDPWPANWSRHRLAQLAGAAATSLPPPAGGPPRNEVTE